MKTFRYFSISIFQCRLHNDLLIYVTTKVPTSSEDEIKTNVNGWLTMYIYTNIMMMCPTDDETLNSISCALAAIVKTMECIYVRAAMFKTFI